TFFDRSPDRAPVSWAPPEAVQKTARKLSTFRREGSSRWSLFFKDEDRSLLEVGYRDGSVELDARSKLPTAIFTHESRYAEITLRGHSKLSVAFSPMPTKKIELPPPGAPKRFAYVDAAGQLHVVDAQKQNLGPFTELAS